jgi:hypothetical protein
MNNEEELLEKQHNDESTEDKSVTTNWFSTEERQKVFQSLSRQKIQMENIFLDPMNPRIRHKDDVDDSEIHLNKTQEHCKKEIELSDSAKNASLKDKMLGTGFQTEGETLYVRPIDGKPSTYVALEGNRRTLVAKDIKENIVEHKVGKDDEWVNSFDTAWSMVYNGNNPYASRIIQGHRHLGGGKTADWAPIRRAEHYLAIQESYEAFGEKVSHHQIADDEGESDPNVVKKLLLSLKGMKSANNILSTTKKFSDNDFGWFNEVIFSGPACFRKYLGWNDKESIFEDEEHIRNFQQLVQNSQLGSQSVFRDSIKKLFDNEGNPVDEWLEMVDDSGITLDTAIATINAAKKQAQLEKKEQKASLSGYNSDLEAFLKIVSKLPMGAKGGVMKSKETTKIKSIKLLQKIVAEAQAGISTINALLPAKDSDFPPGPPIIAINKDIVNK